MSETDNRSVLLVDDDQRLLDGLRRTLCRHYELTLACGGPEGLAAIERSGPFAVVVSDYKMPVMNGIEFLGRVRTAAPDTVRVMLTGNADMQAAIDAINRGHIFRFLTKPCQSEVLRSGLDAGLKQYRLAHAERQLLEETLQGSVQVLSDLLALVNPFAFGRARRLRAYVAQLVARLGLEQGWRFETAALLCEIGSVTVPQDLLERASAGEQLEETEAGLLARCPEVAHDLLAHIPRLEEVARMIRCGHPGAVAARQETDHDIALGGRLLAAVIDLDRQLTAGRSRKEALATVAQQPGIPAELVRALGDLEIASRATVLRTLPPEQLRSGMVLDEDVHNAAGALVVPRGQEITESLLQRLRNYERLGVIPAALRVRAVVSE